MQGSHPGNSLQSKYRNTIPQDLFINHEIIIQDHIIMDLVIPSLWWIGWGDPVNDILCKESQRCRSQNTHP